MGWWNGKIELTTRITKHYKQAIIKKIYKLIGSAEILGNPLSLVSNMGTGVFDFFNEPAKAIIHSPSEFGTGLKRGTSSLVHKSFYGIANSTSKFTGSMAHLASFFTFNQQFQRDWAARYQRPQGAVSGLQQAAKCAGGGVVQALMDFVNEPLVGARSGGTTGAILGTLRGTSGVFIKSVVSVFGSASIAAEGIGVTLMNWEQNRTRSRLPRYIGSDGVIRVYNEDEAAGQLFLKCLDSGKFSEEIYQFSVSISEGLLLLSNVRILIIKDSQITWNCEISNIRGLQLTPQYIIIHVKLPPIIKNYLYFSSSYGEATKFLVPFEKETIVPIYEHLLSYIKSQVDKSC